MFLFLTLNSLKLRHILRANVAMFQSINNAYFTRFVFSQDWPVRLKNENGTLKQWIMVCRTILRLLCTIRSRLSPKMANLPSVISLICKEKLLMWYSVMETHSRQMPCTSVAVSKYGCYSVHSLLYVTFQLHFSRVGSNSSPRKLAKIALNKRTAHTNSTEIQNSLNLWCIAK